MDIENREKALLQKNASISANSSPMHTPKIENKLPRRVSIERNRHPSDSSSISSINTAVNHQGRETRLYFENSILILCLY